METNQFTFKTNINCGGCIATVKPFLDNNANILLWNVDTSNKDKILTIDTTGITYQQVIEIIQKAGFKIERIK